MAEKLLFAKEAAEYLNITTQRLNILVKEGKVKPLKKNLSGTVFHIDELDRRKEELKIFDKISPGGKKGMFQFDTTEKREALNFSTLINALEITEQRLDPIFTDFSKETDVSVFMTHDESLLGKYSGYFKVGVEKALRAVGFKSEDFSSLRFRR